MIYPDYKSAHAALKKFHDELQELEVKYGISYTYDDECSSVYAQVEYYNEDGKVLELSE